ncbi:G5 and 3D domain-containing protein [Bacillus tuaregi]|uniref:G5 and 3D domain-containing protein n=1 Tax=Bacillus tuaregi TaxID=1816695 RepID=UPI0008F97460|nr:G5 and 3D domain-containing protein [Bacillus tuaregi]
MKNLFSKLNTKNWSIIIASFIVLLFSAGFVTYETTKKSVTLSLEGKEKVMKTHAATVQELLEEADISLQSKDYLLPAKDTGITDNLKVVWKSAKQVKLLTVNEEKTFWTTAITVDEFLAEQNIEINEFDHVKPKSDAALKTGMNVVVNKAFPLTFNDGGVVKEVWSTSTTVADFLKQQGITLTELDRVEPGLENTVSENGIVNVIRVEKVTDVVEEPLSFAVVTQKDENLDKGSEKVLTPGQEGLVSREYEVTKENGQEVSRVVLNETVLKDKVDQVVAVGAKEITALASRGSESGREMYVTATAYTASCSGCSGITATGVNLHANPGAKVIAVDPRVIPLGSKVYVEGYGYAVAADTGGAIKGNKIDVFISSKQAAYQWGRKTVKIKVLD